MDIMQQPAPGRRQTLVIAALAACYLVWGSTYLAIRYALESFPPFFQMGTRFLVAGALLMLWVRWRGGAMPNALQWRNALVVGSLMLAGGMGLVGVAEVHIGSGLIAAFIAVVPLMVCAIGLAFGQRPRRLEVAGMLLGLAGVFLLLRGSSFSAAPVGVASIACATFAWSLGSVLSTSRMPLAAGAAGFASEMLCGGAVLMAISLALGEKPQWPPSPVAAAAWLYLVVLGSLVAFSAYMYLLANAPPALATSYAFVNPVIALALGVAVGNEVVTHSEWGACAVILGGVLMLLAARRRA